MTTIDDSNYELWLLRYAEQELTPAERQTVEQWLAQNPEAAAELALYNDAPRLQRNVEVRFGGVLPQANRPLWTVILRWTAAAAVVAALMLPVATMVDPAPEHLMQLAQANPIPAPILEDTTTVSEPVAPQVVLPRVTATIVSEAEMPTETLALADDTIETPVALPAVEYVDDLIVFEEEPTSSDNCVAAVYMEHTNAGIALPRLIGSILKSNLK